MGAGYGCFVEGEEYLHEKFEEAGPIELLYRYCLPHVHELSPVYYTEVVGRVEPQTQ